MMENGDIRETVSSERPSNLSEVELRLLFENMISPFSYYRMVYDAQGVAVDYVFVAVNKAFELETGLAREQLIGKSVLSVYPQTERYWLECFGRVAKTGVPEHISNYSAALGRWYEIMAYCPKPDFVAMTVFNVTDTVYERLRLMEKTVELNRQQSENYRITHEDPVTRLPNRLSFFDAFDQLTQSGANMAQIAVVVISLDAFAELNASYGSVLGDRLLKAVAARLLLCLAPPEKLFNLSGPSFVLLTPNISDHPDALVSRLNVLLDEISKPLETEGNHFHLTASSGVACYPQRGLTADDLLMRANLALYRAQNRGGNAMMFYSNTMGETLLKRTRIRHSLYKALDSGEFELYYQPQIDARTQKPVGVEALLRWHSAELGEVPPQDFIGIAEETRLINPIGEWVFRTACEALQALNARFDTQWLMAVNISGVQLLEDDFAPRVFALAQQCGLPMRQMELEITESVFLQRNFGVAEKLAELRTRGFRLALDDFGTGYSSLGMLGELSISTLKIDKTFITRTNATLLTHLIVKMGRLMNATIVAEGVETKAQRKMVTDIGCDRIQGYYYSPPLPFSELVPYLEKALAGGAKST